MGFDLANLNGHRHEYSAARSYCFGDKQTRQVLGVRTLGLWNVEFVKPRPPAAIIGDFGKAHEQ